MSYPITSAIIRKTKGREKQRWIKLLLATTLKKVSALNEKYYTEERVNKGYYLRGISDVAAAGIQLIKANYKTHDFKHRGDRVGNIISFLDEDLQHTVHCCSELLKYRELWLEECKGDVKKFEEKLQQLTIKDQKTQVQVDVKKTHLVATSDLVYPVVADLDFSNKLVTKDEIIMVFCKIVHKNKKAQVAINIDKATGNYETPQGGTKTESGEDTWTYLSGTQTVRIPLRFIVDMIHATQRIMMDSLLSSLVMTNNTYEDKADVKDLLIKMLR